MDEKASLYESSSGCPLPTSQYAPLRVQNVGTLSFIHVDTNTRGLSGVKRLSLHFLFLISSVAECHIIPGEELTVGRQLVEQ